MNSKLITAVLLTAVLVIGGIYLANDSGLKISSQAGTPEKEQPTAPQADQISPAESVTGYSLADVAKHNHAGDCWIAIEGKVYDVSDYVNRHPGGSSILQGCGKDATNIFNSRPGSGSPHPEKARQMLLNYFIGELKQ